MTDSKNYDYDKYLDRWKILGPFCNQLELINNLKYWHFPKGLKNIEGSGELLLEERS